MIKNYYLNVKDFLMKKDFGTDYCNVQYFTKEYNSCIWFSVVEFV